MSTLKVTNLQHPSATAPSLVLTANSGLSGISSVGITTVYASNIVGVSTLGVTTAYINTLSGNCLASVSNIAGINTTGVTTSGSAAVTLTGSGQAANISNGDYVVGTGITAGTTVSTGAGTTNLILSQTVGVSWISNPLTFYSNNKIVTPGVIGRQLCRAWINFNGTGTVAIRASYNVSSITDNNTGDYTVNFTTAFPDANYSATGCGYPTSNNTDVVQLGTLSASSAGVFGRVGNSVSGVAADMSTMCFSFFR